MVRVKRGVISIKRRKNVLKKTKGFRNARKSKEREAKVAIAKAGVYAFAHRRDKKNDFRMLWNIKIGAALDPLGLSYSKFIDMLKKKNIAINRKMLAEMAEETPQAFENLVSQVHPVK